MEGLPGNLAEHLQRKTNMKVEYGEMESLVRSGREDAPFRVICHEKNIKLRPLPERKKTPRKKEQEPLFPCCILQGL